MSLSNIRTVAVIGAGISGVTSAAHLLRQGLEVTVFERSSTAGGVWHFDEETAIEPSYPNETPSKGDYDPLPRDDSRECLTPRRTPDKDVSDGETTSSGEGRAQSRVTVEEKVQGSYARIAHAPPGPCYAGLKNNVPLTLMKTTLAEWPPGLEEFDCHRHLDEYIQRTARLTGVGDVAHYDTRVDKVAKSGEKWDVETTTWRPSARPSYRSWSFDAIVVATGHYHMPRTPDFPGLRELKERFPARIRHSKGYRHAEAFRDQTVLLVGAGTSSTDIAKELAGIAKHVYQSSRGGQFDHPASVLPSNATRIGSIQSFEVDETRLNRQSIHGTQLAARVVLSNGQRLCGIDHIVICTGYVTSYPYLSQFHDDSLADFEADPKVLVTKDGNMVHNLHRDIFYIEDPTLAFVGKPYHTANFSLFEFQAQIVARAFSARLDLPPRSDMRAEYDARVAAKGLGRDFHSLRATGAEPAYAQQLVDWANEYAEGRGVERMQGHTEAWKERYRQFREMIEKRIGLKLAESKPRPGLFDKVVLVGSNVC